MQDSARHLKHIFLVLVLAAFAGCPDGPDPRDGTIPGEGPILEAVSLTQAEIASGAVPLIEIRRVGRFVFSAPFNFGDGFGDGPFDVNENHIAPGGRPTLQNNGTFLRMNGLDSQSCLECHSVLSSLEVPASFAVGGAGGSSANAIVEPRIIDMLDELGAGFASFDGRFINPPFVFGAGGVELIAKEMTAELQQLKAEAEANPGTDVPLVTKGVSFGVLRFDDTFDFSRVEGIDADLVVKPFGRKGERFSVRDFDQAAMEFHFGIQPVERVGAGVDADGDGLTDEISVGAMSALHIFGITLDRPEQRGVTPATVRGGELFEQIGCTECHIPALVTNSRFLPVCFPEVADAPFANQFYQVDLAAERPGFELAGNGGVVVPLFADLKRHDMGEGLTESFGTNLDPWFTTARLWGVADTAPYLHDGRALTLNEAILWHGGEAQAARDAYDALPDSDKGDLLRFLRSLRTPEAPAADLDADS